MPLMPCILFAPLALLLAFYLRPNFPQPRAAEFLLVLALWSVLQAVVLAYGRANYGGPIPNSRYMDLLDIIVIAGVFAAFLLAQLWERHLIRNGILAFVFIAIVFAGLCDISQIVVNGLLAPSRMKIGLVAEERVQRFLANGSESDFLEHPTVPPDPRLALSVLRDADLQTILPAACLPPTAAVGPERLMPFSRWLMEHSAAILLAGVALFVVLCGFGLQGKLGMAAKNPVGLIALLAGLAALGFVWSKHNVTRNSVEYQLQVQIAANFKAAGNLKRAAIHEQKAAVLKQFAN